MDIGTPPPVDVTIVAGGGDDCVNVRQIGGPLRILGGAGNDRVVVQDNNLLNRIGSSLFFDGDAAVAEQDVEVAPAEVERRLGGPLTAAPLVYVHTSPDDSGATYTDPFGRLYKLPEMAPVLALAPSTGGVILRRVVVVAGVVVQDYVQDWDGSHQLLYLDAAGNRTTTVTDVPALILVNRTEDVYFTECRDAESRDVSPNVDTLTVSDTADTGNVHAVVDQEITVEGGMPGVISYDGIESVNVGLGGGNDVADVRAPNGDIALDAGASGGPKRACRAGRGRTL